MTPKILPRKRHLASTTRSSRPAYGSWLLDAIAGRAGELIDAHPTCPPPINRQVDRLTLLADHHAAHLRSGAIR